jgi:hypothetical protein
MPFEKILQLDGESTHSAELGNRSAKKEVYTHNKRVSLKRKVRVSRLHDQNGNPIIQMTDRNMNTPCYVPDN